MAASPVIAIHGGAGTLTRSAFTDELQREYRAGLAAALEAGAAVLAAGGHALDAVTAAVVSLEDCPLFNAGRGAVLTRAGTFEHDAAVMDGATRRAGAVGGVATVRNPILAARAVMARTSHVLMIGPAAEALARDAGLEIVTADYFRTQARTQQLRDAIARGQATVLDHDGQHTAAMQARFDKYGTVGAVALDATGHLAAATSTGGLTNKLPGRVGDSALIGAGCYADDRTLAVSSTGQGEKFIETVGCYRAAALMEYGGRSLAVAAHATIHVHLAEHGGRGGLIALDRNGNLAMPFNTEGMYRGWLLPGEAPVTAIFGDEA